MRRQIKLSPKRRVAATCGFSALALVGLVGGLYSINASADGEIVINFSDATSVTQTTDGAYEANYLVNNNNITLTFGNFVGISTTSKTLTINPNNRPDINFTYIGNLTENYTVKLRENDPSVQNPFETQVSCIYTSHEQNSNTFEEGITNCQIPASLNIPASTNLIIETNNQQQGNAPIIVGIAANTFGDNNKTATFSNFGNSDSRSITFTNAWNTENNPHFEFENDGNQATLKTNLATGLTFHAEGDCMNGTDDSYVVKFGTQNGWNKTFVCNNGDYTLEFSDEENIPSEGLNIWIQSANQPGPAQDYYVEFENVSSVSDNQDYVLVTSRDESLAGKTWKLTPSSGRIGCTGDEQGTHCGITFANSPFADESDFYITISGEGFDLDTDAIMIFLRGPAGANGVAQISKVGNNYQFMLRGSSLPDGVNAISIDIEEPHQEGGDDGREPHPGEQVAPTTVTVKQNQGNPNIAKSFYLSRININWESVFENEDCEWNKENRADDTLCPATYTRENFSYNKETDKNTVEIDFGTLFNLRYINSVKVNGATYQIPFNYTDRQAWLEHYSHQMTSFTIEVPYSESGYVIEVDVDELEDKYQQIGNFLWTNDENDKYDSEGRLNDAYIGHSNLEVLNVNCHITSNDDDDVFFRVGIDEVPEGCVFEYRPDDDRNTTGSLVVPEGSTITVRLKPQYGWQVTSFRMSGDEEIATDPGAVAQYTLGIRRGNAHIGAVVTEVDDEVNAVSDKVKSGSIALGGAEIEEGTAMLSVNDADLTDEQKAEFQNQAGNYNVSTFLDIDLDQVFYDGMGGYWQGEEMSELAHEATITLTLEEGVDGNSVILVHKKHDGTYEIIPTTYDAKTHTITFKTSSFSDYAIASATVKNANTLDGITKYFALFVLSSAAAIFVASKKEQTSSAE